MDELQLFSRHTHLLRMSNENMKYNSKNIIIFFMCFVDWFTFGVMNDTIRYNLYKKIRGIERLGKI